MLTVAVEMSVSWWVCVINVVEEARVARSEVDYIVNLHQGEATGSGTVLAADDVTEVVTGTVSTATVNALK
jgi:hypothetical protein